MRLTKPSPVLSYKATPNKTGPRRTEPAMDQETVKLTDNAVRRIARILGAEPDGTALRVSVEGGGCSGFQYKYDLTRDHPAQDDIVLARDGARVLIDTISLQYMGGSEIDFVDDLMGQSFQIRNPIASASCGCGTSFTI
jgi:iron-sulfur cluster assembly accessory protein